MTRTTRDILNEANPNKLPTAAQQARLGSQLAIVPRFIRIAVSSNKATLPESAKAAYILACYVTAGTVNGRFEPIWDSTPATTRVSIDAQGNVVFVSGDAVTECELLYVPVEGQVFEDVISVASDSGAPLASRRIHTLLEVESLAGTTVGALTVGDRGSAAAAGAARASLLGAAVVFHGDDAVTRARIKYIATPGQGATKPALGVELDTERAGY